MSEFSCWKSNNLGKKLKKKHTYKVRQLCGHLASYLRAEIGIKVDILKLTLVYQSIALWKQLNTVISPKGWRIHVKQWSRISHCLDYDSAFQSQAEYVNHHEQWPEKHFSFYKEVMHILYKDLSAELCMLIISRLDHCYSWIWNRTISQFFYVLVILLWFPLLTSLQQTCSCRG